MVELSYTHSDDLRPGYVTSTIIWKTEDPDIFATGAHASFSVGLRIGA
jgi:hypothetical protein